MYTHIMIAVHPGPQNVFSFFFLLLLLLVFMLLSLMQMLFRILDCFWLMTNYPFASEYLTLSSFLSMQPAGLASE